MGLAPLYNPIVTRKDSTFYAPTASTPKRELVSLLTIKMSVAVATPGSGLAESILEIFSEAPVLLSRELQRTENFIGN